MSHFTVLVIGDNIEEQLYPYHELECTMDQKEIKDDPRSEFIVEIDSYEELKKELKTNHIFIITNKKEGKNFLVQYQKIIMFLLLLSILMVLVILLKIL